MRGIQNCQIKVGRAEISESKRQARLFKACAECKIFRLHILFDAAQFSRVANLIEDN